MTRPSCSLHECPQNDQPLMNDATHAGTSIGLAPFSLKDAPSFIERQFPVGRLSAEAYKERKAVAGQTLTALGSYWKGRKPLILVRAVMLGCLLPATEDAVADLDIFLKLMAMDDAAFGRRFDDGAMAFTRLFPDSGELATVERGRRRVWRNDLREGDRQTRVANAFASRPYAERLKHVRRPEECDQGKLLAPIWSAVNSHYGTTARSLPELIEQLGVARFGHRPKVADTFCGAGSIPFEAARIGCNIYASDVNPVACMLTWGAFNLIGASNQERAKIEAAQAELEAMVDAEITRLGVEHDADGNRAKAYLYCLETRCPKTGWMVPMLPSFVISDTRRVIVRLRPDYTNKRYDILIETGVPESDMTKALIGTLRDGRLFHPMNPERSGVDIRTIRGEYRDADGVGRNALRLWEVSDTGPRADDIFQERLYCIQWIRNETIGKTRQETYFASVTHSDLERELLVMKLAASDLSTWQSDGLVPDMAIESGKENEGPIRTNGWTHWHHMFMPRAILTASLISKFCKPIDRLILCKYLDNNSKSCRWAVSQSGGDGGAKSTFDSQALRTIFNWSFRSFDVTPWRIELNDRDGPAGSCDLKCIPAHEIDVWADLFVSDPPYADAVRYEEITEFFIAWLRSNPPSPFDQWTWNSRRDLAIKGKDEQFRRDMVAAYTAMNRHMPQNGMQVVMFTHQDAGVWADLGSILWAAGLRVSAAWNIVTETESALKEGNYVQGTVCLVLRKRIGEVNARRMEIEAEIEGAVATQLARLNALDDSWHERANAETLYTDGDLTLAAYAAALQVVTAYSSIDRQPLDRDLYRKLSKNETTMLRDLIDYAAQVANALLVPEGFPKDVWRDLGAGERFYVRMLDMEAKGSAKVADFQNFARSFAFGAYTDLMASTTANAAALAGAADLKGRMLSGEGFWGTQLRQVLFATWKTMEGRQRDPKRGVTILKAEYAADYWQRRQKLISFAAYVALKTRRTRPDESDAAGELAEALKLDRV
jgi:putative DNA methylase